MPAKKRAKKAPAKKRGPAKVYKSDAAAAGASRKRSIARNLAKKTPKNAAAAKKAGFAAAVRFVAGNKVRKVAPTKGKRGKPGKAGGYASAQG